MIDVAIALCFLAGAAGCLGLVVWVLRRDHLNRQALERTSSEPNSIVRLHEDPKTEFISREELLTAAEQRAAMRDDPTEYLLQAEVFSAVQHWVPAIATPGTDRIPREALLAQQQPRPSMSQRTPTPEPRPPAPPPKPTAIGLSLEELEPQLQAAEQAFRHWSRARDSMMLDELAESHEPALRRAIGIVAAASDDACAALVEPALSCSTVGVHRRQAAALVLLLRNEARALRLIESCVGDGQLAPPMHEVLTLWRGPETDWRLREQARQARNTRMFWLDLLEVRRIDPGPELLQELLASDDPELIVRGLQLAKYHDNPERRTQAALVHMNDMRRPAQRMAAVELALLDRHVAAWMFCRQMANSPEYPRATELVASLGTVRELDPLLRRLESAHGEGLWLLCRSGRKAAAALAARRLQDTRGDELAAVALRYVIGDPPSQARSAEALLDHWIAVAPNLAADRRYLHGELIGYTDGVRRCLTSREDRHHRAFGDELFFRSQGKMRWPGRGFACDILTSLAALRTHTIVFEAGL